MYGILTAATNVGGNLEETQLLDGSDWTEIGSDWTGAKSRNSPVLLRFHLICRKSMIMLDLLYRSPNSKKQLVRPSDRLFLTKNAAS